MKRMKFSRLSLLSRNERRALQISFSPGRTAIVAGNGYGKSAILKSLYESLAAKPHKIDQAWLEADPISLLELSIDGVPYSALRTRDTFTVLDSSKNMLVQTSSIMRDLAPFFAELLDFRLVLADRLNAIKTPPPSYAFAPFYVDQDRSWQRPWDSFKDLAIFPRSAHALAEYHSGIKPNEYYVAKAERDT